MLTRLKISGFKNLVDVDIRFGPFTCIAGANGVGKSNLFDAIKFLSALANNTLIESALSVRHATGGQTPDIRTLFHRIGNQYDDKMSFEIEMIVPKEGVDDLGQKAKAAITFLRYKLVLAYQEDSQFPSIGSLGVLSEVLEHINLGEAHKRLSFPHAARNWRNTAVQGRRTTPFISTDGEGDKCVIKLHQDGNSGRPKTFLARTLPRTVVSTVNATESPTALLARREMQSWRLLQLEPSALREPDEFTGQPDLGADGSHLPATLYYLAQSHARGNEGHSSTWLYEQIANRLSDLIDDVYAVDIDRDEKRQLLTLEVTDSSKTTHPARSLSDGTLRFLALAVLEQDTKASGLICLEEPENGIHPKRIAAMLQLLGDIAVDVDEPIGPDNPLQQVIINTHSPVVVSLVSDDSLIVAELKETIKDNERFNSVRFSWLPDTWRADAEPTIYPVARGVVLAYLKYVTKFGTQSTYPHMNGKKKAIPVEMRQDLFPQLSSSEE